MSLLLGGFAVVGLGLVLAGKRLRRAAYLVGLLPTGAAVVWTCLQLPTVTTGRPITSTASWVPGLGLAIDLRLDGLAATMTLVIAGIGVLVLSYAATYFSADRPDQGRLAGLLVLFAGAMVGLVQADHLLLLYTCWELTTVTSYLLIGNTHTDARARAAALQALAVTGTGGLAMLGGFVILGQAAGTFRLSGLVAGGLPDGPAVTVGILLVLLGAFTKSAQYPFHAWLPGAMIAPTPISAYLHSATMVKAGVYLVARLAPLLAAAAVWRPAILAAGALTLVAGGLRALRQRDLKLLLAFGTVSQLGLMMLLFGLGTPAATTAGWALLVAHALFKAALFMVVGIVDSHAGTRDLTELPRFDRRWRMVEVASAVSAMSMAGVPLAAGFIAKEEAYGALLEAPVVGAEAVLAVVVGGSMLTAAYAWRFHWGAFLAARRRADAPTCSAAPGWRFSAPVLLLAAGSALLGVVPGLEDRLAQASVRWLGYADAAVHLELWHGFTLPLGLSVLTLAGAAVIAAGGRTTQRVLAVGEALPSGQDLHLAILRLIDVVARTTTAVTQSGSLPVYAAVVLLTAASLPLAALLTDWSWPGWPALGSAGDLPVVLLLAASAIGAAVVRKRFAAAVLLGAAGYSMAMLFVAYGAPDLALTQVAVETLSTVVFVLVLRLLPARFERPTVSLPWFERRRVGRLVAATAVGASVFVIALAASGVDSSTAVSDELVARAEPDGHGHNVVNVILVDFRGLDTMGEITVLAAASIGAVALARAGRRTAGMVGAPPDTSSAARPGRIVFVDVSVRLLFHAVLMLSVWLLAAGHNQPGGGFVGGLLAGSAIALRYVAGGMPAVRGRTRFRPWTVLGVGLLIAACTALAPLLIDGSVLEVAYGPVTFPVIGEVSLSSALLFDTGVYVTVVGMVLMIFEAFGEQPPGVAVSP